MKTNILYHFLLAGIFSCLISGCGNKSRETSISESDTIYLGDLREKFKGDSLFFNVVAPDLILIQNQYTWASTEKEAQKKGLSKAYYLRVQEEISKTNEAIRDGVMRGANAKRIYDFQNER